MSEFFYIGSRKLVPLKDVTKIVPYTRDYVARLARDGRVAAAQINRQWYIDVESIKNFFEHAQLEVQARTAYVRSLRKEELDLHEWWSAFTKTQKLRQETRTRRVAGKTIIVMIFGLLVGLLVTNVGPVMTPAHLAALVNDQQVAASVEAVAAPHWYETGVVIEHKSLENPTGILLMPATDATSTDPSTFFSDSVVIEQTSATTGLIHSSSSSSSVPFVQIGHDDVSSVTPSP